MEFGQSFAPRVCPTCGRCPTCGNGGGFQFYPLIYPPQQGTGTGDALPHNPTVTCNHGGQGANC